MAVSMVYGIPQIISFKWYTICGPWVYSYLFTKYVVFPKGGERVKIDTSLQTGSGQALTKCLDDFALQILQFRAHPPALFTNFFLSSPCFVWAYWEPVRRLKRHQRAGALSVLKEVHMCVIEVEIISILVSLEQNELCVT